MQFRVSGSQEFVLKGSQASWSYGVLRIRASTLYLFAFTTLSFLSPMQRLYNEKAAELEPMLMPSSVLWLNVFAVTRTSRAVSIFFRSIERR